MCSISKTTDNSHMKVKNGKVYGISRVYHNYNKNETELSLRWKDERKVNF